MNYLGKISDFLDSADRATDEAVPSRIKKYVDPSASIDEESVSIGILEDEKSSSGSLTDQNSALRQKHRDLGQKYRELDRNHKERLLQKDDEIRMLKSGIEKRSEAVVDAYLVDHQREISSLKKQLQDNEMEFTSALRSKEDLIHTLRDDVDRNTKKIESSDDHILMRKQRILELEQINGDLINEKTNYTEQFSRRLEDIRTGYVEKEEKYIQEIDLLKSHKDTHTERESTLESDHIDFTHRLADSTRELESQKREFSRIHDENRFLTANSQALKSELSQKTTELNTLRDKCRRYQQESREATVKQSELEHEFNEKIRILQETADSHALTIEEQKTEMSQYVHVPVNCACQTVRVQNSQSKKADSNLISLLQSRLENSNKSLLERQEQVEKLIGTKGEVEVFNQNLKDKIRRLEDDLGHESDFATSTAPSIRSRGTARRHNNYAPLNVLPEGKVKNAATSFVSTADNIGLEIGIAFRRHTKFRIFGVLW